MSKNVVHVLHGQEMQGPDAQSIGQWPNWAGSASESLAPETAASDIVQLFVTAAMAFTLPPLPYDYATLEPHIDARTMEIHHTKVTLSPHHPQQPEGVTALCSTKALVCILTWQSHHGDADSLLNSRTE